MNSLKICTICHSAKHRTRKCIQYDFCNDMLVHKLEFIANTFGLTKVDRNIDFVHATSQILKVPCCGKNTLKYMVSRLLNQTLFWSGADYTQSFIRHHKQPTKPIGKMTFVQLQNLYKMVMQANIDFYKESAADSAADADATDESCPICLESKKEKNTCTTTCGHSFCSDCFFKTLQLQIDTKGTATCPLCRTECISSSYFYRN